MIDEARIFRETLSRALSLWRFSASSNDLDRLETHFIALLEANAQFNLTRITDPAEAAVKHYADSLAPLLWLRDRNIAVSDLLDVGTGAGFPAIPLAVFCPSLNITALEATAKKANFVRRTATAMKLSNLSVIHAHSVHWRSSERFGMVVARAVAKVPDLFQQISHLVRPDGYLVSFQTTILPPEQHIGDGGCRLRLREQYRYDLECGSERLSRVLYILQRGR